MCVSLCVHNLHARERETQKDREMLSESVIICKTLGQELMQRITDG